MLRDYIQYLQHTYRPSHEGKGINIKSKMKGEKPPEKNREEKKNQIAICISQVCYKESKRQEEEEREMKSMTPTQEARKQSPFLPFSCLSVSHSFPPITPITGSGRIKESQNGMRTSREGNSNRQYSPPTTSFGSKRIPKGQKQ